MNESKSKTMSLYQIYLLQQVENQLGIRHQMYLSYLHTRVQCHFNLLSEKQNQNYLNVLIIEEKVKHLKNIYENCLLDKLELLNQINADHINLQQFQELGLNLLQKKTKFEKLKKEIQKKWKQNNLVKELLPFIQNNLGFTLNMESFYQVSDQIIPLSIVQNYPSKATALISFSQNNLGEIIKSTKQFCKLFEVECTNHINIYNFIPAEFHKEHTQLVNDFLLNFSTEQIPSNNQIGINKSQINFVIAQSKKGFCLPLTINFNVEYIAQFNTIAIFTTFTPILSSSYFLICEQTSYNLRLVTQNFYLSYLAQFIDNNNLHNLEASSFIPLLKGQLEQQQNYLSENKNQTIQTIGILPTKEYFTNETVYKYSKLSEILSRNHFNQNMFQIFKVQFQIRKLQQIKSSKLIIIEVVSIQTTTSESEFQQCLIQLKKIMFPIKQSSSKDQQQQSSRSSSPINCFPPINNIINSTKLKQIPHELQELFPNQDLSEVRDYVYNEEQSYLEFTPNYNRLTNRNNADVTQDSFAFLKALSQNHSQLSPRYIRPSMTTLNTLQDHILNVGQLSKNPSESILHLLFPKSKETEESIIQFKDSSLKNPDNSIQYLKNQFQQYPLEQNQALSKRRSNCHRETMHVTFKEFTSKINDIQQENKNNYSKSIRSEYSPPKGQINQSSSESNNLKEYNKVSNKCKKENQEFDLSSQNSGQTGIQIQIRTIRTKLSNKKLSNSLWALNFFGLMSLILIVSMSFYQFSQMISGLISIKFDLHFVDWPSSVSAVCNGIWMQINLLLINDHQVFPNLNNNWLTYKQDISNKVFTLTKFGQKIYRDQIVSDYEIGWYFWDFTWRRNNFYMGRQNLPKTEMVQLLHRDPEVVFEQKYMANMYYYYLRVYETQEEQLMITKNYQEFQKQLNLLSTQISESSIQVDVYTLMIVTISLTFFQVVLTIPIYLYIQTERETILKLFSTLQKLSLEKMKNSCIDSIQNVAQVDIKKYLAQKSTQDSVNIKQINNNFTSSRSTKRLSELSISEVTFAKKTSVLQTLELNTKKKLISTTSTIPKFHFFLPLFGLFFFILICIQPIANAILFEKFKEECRTIFSGLDNIFNMKDTLTKYISFTYGDAYSKLTPLQNNYLFNQTFFEANMPAIIIQGQQRLNNLNQMATKIQQEYSESKSYLNIINQLLQENICDVIQKYPEMHTIENQITFNYQKCNQSRNGILQSGFQVACQYFLSQMVDLFEISSIQDETIRKNRFYKWESNFDVHSFNEFYDQLLYVVGFAQKIFLDNGYDKINQMWSTQIILSIIQIILLILIFCAGWLNFFKIIINQLQKNRQLITLFEPDQIIENPYFMSYINKLK